MNNTLMKRINHTVRASTFLRTELLANRTEPYYIGTPKKSSFCQKLFDLPKVRFGTVREKVDARTVYAIFFFFLYNKWRN